MEHVVFFPAPDGTPAFRRFAALEEAVRFVEHLRNVENVSEASVHALTEVPLTFKAWYRVELPGGADVTVPASVEPTAHRGTIAEAIETYSQPSAVAPAAVLPEAGSVTGIVVPDQPFIAVDQFAAPAISAHPVAPERAAASPADDQQANVLEPAFGAPRARERGNGYFVR